MLHSDCSLFGGKWDTNHGGQFLKISDEELKVLDNIPGWSKVRDETSEDQASESETNALTSEKPSILLQTSVPRNTDNQSPILIQNPNKSTDISVHDSDSLPEISRIAPSTDKDNFMRSISLYFNKVVGVFSKLPRRRSNSVSDIHLLKVKKNISSSKSETNLAAISLSVSAEQFATDKYLARKFECINSIPVSLGDKNDSVQTTDAIHSHINSESRFGKKTLEKLGADILNHPYLKETLPIEHTFNGNGIPSLVEKKNEDREQLRKKLELLRKRFSQPGNCDLFSSSEESAKNEVDLESLSSQKLSPVVSEIAKKVFTTVSLSKLVNDNQEINSIADLNTSTNTAGSSLYVDAQSNGKTLWKQKKSHFIAIQAEDKSVLLSIPNAPEDINCTFQQDSLNPVVIHLSSEFDAIPQSSNSYSSTQQSEVKSKDTESNISVSCVTTQSSDAHSFVHHYSSNQPAMSEVNTSVPVPRRISSSSDMHLSDQSSLKSQPETLSPIKSKFADICVPVPSGMPSDAHLSIQSNLTNPEIRSSMENIESVHCRLSQSTARSNSMISQISHQCTDEMSSVKSKGLENLVLSERPSPADSPSLTFSNIVNQPETKSMAKTEDSMRNVGAENEGATFSVFSDNPSGWVVDKSSASSEVVKVRGKRKRQSKDDHKPLKKSSLSNSQVDIQYTPEQVRIMVEIMRFQFNK